MLMSDTVYTLILAIPAILVAITIHEAMHAVVSDRLGDDTARLDGRITLNPIHHIDPFGSVLLPLILILLHLPVIGAAKPVQINKLRLKYDDFGAAIVAAAGPASNLVLALLGAVLFRVMNVHSGAAADFLTLFVSINVGFFVFNLIPFPPLDGSRILYALAPEPVQEFMDMIEAYGITAFLIFFILFYQFFSPVIGNIINHILNVLLPVNL